MTSGEFETKPILPPTEIETVVQQVEDRDTSVL